MHKVDIAEKLALITEHWRPKLVGELNRQEVKLVKFQGTFVWHSHELGPGEFIIVSHGVEHRTVADEEAALLVFEPAGVRNTGDVSDAVLAAPNGVRI